jgi:internalin A
MDIKLRRLAILVALAFICGCSNEKEQPKQPVAGDNRRDAKMEPTDSPFSDERSLEFDGPSFTDASLKALPHLDKIEVLTLANTAVTDEGCRELLRARSLVEIAIISDEITDDTLAVLAQLPSLRSLQIHHGPKIGDEGLEHLRGCTGLRELYLMETAITDRGLLAIQNLPQVWSLILDGTAVSDEGVAALAEMQKLFLLSLKNTRVVGHGVAKLRDNEHLSVYMDETPATDEGVIAIAQGLSNLKVISLNRTTVGDRVAEALSKLPRLNDVRFSHTKLTDEGLSAFSGHPFLDVIYVRGCAVTESTTNMVKKTSPRRLTVYGL